MLVWHKHGDEEELILAVLVELSEVYEEDEWDELYEEEEKKYVQACSQEGAKHENI